MDKKQIEEMAKDIDSIFPYNKAIGNLPQWLAIELKKQGYRKITENEVIISKDNYETYKQVLAEWSIMQQENLGCRKVDKHETVISKEEYEKIWKKGYEEGYSILVDDTIKKTAREYHDDYNKPLVVRYLCFSCHRKWHKKHDNPELLEEQRNENT